MKPEEKAKQLVDKLQDECVGMEIYWAKQCALLCVDEILQEFENVMTPNPFKMYWNEVKKEIKRM